MTAPTVAVFRTIPRPALVVPSARPAVDDWCFDAARTADTVHRCTRPVGHKGRHATIWHWHGGTVRAVWEQTLEAAA
jgi:hypothetical protein